MKNKNGAGAISDMVFMGYRIVMIIIIGFLVIGISVFAYNNDVNVKQVESIILAKNLYNCFVSENYILMKESIRDYKNSILEYCGYDKGQISRFYVKVDILTNNVIVESFSQGDSGKMWIYETMKEEKDVSDKNSLPGYTIMSFPIYYEGQNSKINISTLVNDE